MRCVKCNAPMGKCDCWTPCPCGWSDVQSNVFPMYPDSMPQAIKATDAEGRSCVYLPVSVNGHVVDSKGFIFDSRAGSKLEFKA